MNNYERYLRSCDSWLRLQHARSRWLSGRTGRVRSWKPGRNGWRRGYAGEKKCNTPSSSPPSAVFVFLFRRHVPFHYVAPANQWIISNHSVCLFNWLCFIKLSLYPFCESVSVSMAETSAHITHLHIELISYERVIWGIPPRQEVASRCCAAGWTRWKHRGARCAQGHLKIPTKMTKARISFCQQCKRVACNTYLHNPSDEYL